MHTQEQQHQRQNPYTIHKVMHTHAHASIYCIWANPIGLSLLFLLLTQILRWSFFNAFNRILNELVISTSDDMVLPHPFFVFWFLYFKKKKMQSISSDVATIALIYMPLDQKSQWNFSKAQWRKWCGIYLDPKLHGITFIVYLHPAFCTLIFNKYRKKREICIGSIDGKKLKAQTTNNSNKKKKH